MKGPAMGVLENVQFGVGKQPTRGGITCRVYEM